jgi:hypothetical protein
VRIELLYFDGCPSYLVAEERLRNVLRERGLDVYIEMVRVETDEEALRLGFPGSPTIRVDGTDIFPTAEERGGALGCRVYATPQGLAGAPTVGMIGRALGRGVEAGT